MQRIAYLLVWAMAVALASPAHAATTAQISGTADYRERIALPPGAVFEAILEDVSLADAPALELGRTRIADPGPPPFAFEIDFDSSGILPERTYAVRGQVTVGPRLMFVTDSLNPVLTKGATAHVDLWMIKVGETTKESREAPATIGAHGLRLPATFTGDLPCPDCEGIRYRLNLWPDQVFHLRRGWIGAGRQKDTIGRWSVEPKQRALVLRGAGETLSFRIVGDDRLQLQQPDGTAAPGAEPQLLTASSELEPFDLHLPLRGMLTYVDDEARFTECLTGRDYRLVKEGDYDALEHAYLAAGAEAEGPIMTSFEGGILDETDWSDEPDGPGVMVERFIGIWPGETCEGVVDTASLTNTYWKILRLGDTELAVQEGRREPNLVLREGDPRFTATVGCNQLIGSYALADDRLSFGPGASTRMACLPPLDAWEAKLAEVLTESAGWRIDGQTLELLDATDTPIALLQAVYLN
jgi:uncharacterized lipoprotein YbaY/heat shock protein HslJ